MEDDSQKTTDMNEENAGLEGVQTVGTFRRTLPQFLASMTKSLTSFNVGEYFGFLSILIPALTGLNRELNPNETLEITANQASWLPTITNIAIPIGSLMGAQFSDAVGRRKEMVIFSILSTLSWIILGFSESYLTICGIFFVFGFIFGLNEPATATYGIEICEPSIRGMMGSIGLMMFLFGPFTAVSFGAIFSWRQVSFICALSAFISSIALLLVPESPHWLLSKDRFKEAQKSLQWLRGWVSPQTVHKEFVALQNYSNTSNACAECTKQSVRCYHPKPTLCDKMKYLKERQNILPFVMVFILQIFGNFNMSSVWGPYIIQVFNAFGAPIKPTYASVLSSCIGVLGCVFVMFTVKKLGRRKIYLTSTLFIAMCSFGLGIYGFVLLPSGWTSFKVDSNQQPNDPEFITNLVGKYNYLALTLILAISFFGKAGPDSMSSLYIGEVFPFKSRSFMCAISTAFHFLLASISSKTYYNIELWLSLPGAAVFYGVISVIGIIVTYLIIPETEQRSLEDIERHYSDKTKGLRDINIRKQTESVENK